MKSNQIILTGAIGFIGKNLTESLVGHGLANLTIVDHLTPSKRKNLKSTSYKRYYEKDKFLKLIENNSLPIPSLIIHLGACTDTTVQDKSYLLKNNTEYSKSIFRYCLANKVRLMYASSAATYGDGTKGYSEDVRGLNPLNFYGLSKYLFDQWVLKQKKLPPQCVGLRFFNVYGPHEEHKGKMASVVFHGYNQIRKNGDIKLFKSYKQGFKDGEQKRDFVYVKDVVNVILYFMRHQNLSGIYNVGSGKARTFLDLGRSLFKAMNKKANIKFIEMPEELKRKYQYFTQANISKLRLAGYSKKFYSLEEGISDYVSSCLTKSKLG